MNYFHDVRVGSLLNGALQWITSRYGLSIHVIVVFDLMERSFPEIPLPVDFDIEYFYDFSFCQLGVLGECLSLCVVGYYSPAVIWIMKEYKVQLSWTKIIVCKSIDSIAMVQMDTRWLCILSLYFHSLLTSPNWQWSKKKMINNNKQEELGCEIFSDTLTIFLILIDLVLWIMIYEFLWYNKAWKSIRQIHGTVVS